MVLNGKTVFTFIAFVLAIGAACESREHGDWDLAGQTERLDADRCSRDFHRTLVPKTPDT